MLFRDLIRLLEEERPRLGWWVVLLVLSIVFAVIEMVSSIAVLVLVRLFIEGDAAAASSFGGLRLPVPATMPLARLQVLLAVGLLTLFTLRTAAMVIIAYLGARLSTMASVRIARRLLDGYLHLPYVQHTQRRSSDMVRDTFVSTERLHEKATKPLTMIATDAVVIIGLVAALVVVDPFVTLVAGSLLAVATLAVQRIVRPSLRRWSERAQEATSNSLDALQQALSGVRDIRLLGQEDRFLAQHDHERQRLARYHYLTSAGQSVPRSLIELATISTIVVLLLTFGRSDAGSTKLLPTLAMFAYVGLRLQPILNRMVTQANEIRSSHGLITDLRFELAAVGAVAEPKRRPPGEATPTTPVMSATTINNDIVLRDVCFRYPDAPSDPASGVSRRVLDGIDLDIPEGAFVGILGPTGGGKSTLLDLIVGLLEPTSGSITVGGQPLGTTPHWWWQRLGVVSQSIYLTPTTIGENVALGAPTAHDATIIDQVWHALEIAQLADTVKALPRGLDTPVGENGVRLSGGQRQRIALARAVFRRPPVIVLDEGTSALDESTAMRALSALRDPHDARGSRTTLVVVTHNPVTVTNADAIVRLSDGRIESGRVARPGRGSDPISPGVEPEGPTR